jgi:hypothetical protein
MALLALEQGAVQFSSASATTLGMQELAQRYLHMKFWNVIGDIENVLSPYDIKFAVLKGVATEARWYSQMGQRISTDVDLLLDPDAVERAAEVVGVLDPGYGARPSIDFLVRRRLLQHVDLNIRTTQVDLHFDPLKLGIPTRQIHKVLASTEILKTDHGNIRVLRPEIELVLLLLHLNKDGLSFLGTFFDICRILEKAPLDWRFVEDFVVGEGLQVPIWKSLAVVGDVMSLDVKIPHVGGPRGALWDRVWSRGTILNGYEGRRRAPSFSLLLAFHARNRTVDILREVRRQVFPPRQLVNVAGRLNEGESYLRYLTIDRFRRD